MSDFSLNTSFGAVLSGESQRIALIVEGAARGELIRREYFISIVACFIFNQSAYLMSEAVDIPKSETLIWSLTIRKLELLMAL